MALQTPSSLSLSASPARRRWIWLFVPLLVGMALFPYGRAYRAVMRRLYPTLREAKLPEGQAALAQLEALPEILPSGANTAGGAAGASIGSEPSRIAAGDWPTWLGPKGIAAVETWNGPLQWSATEQIRWRMEIPGKGHSSPILVANTLFLTTVVGEDRLELMAVDATTGSQRWQRTLYQGTFPRRHPAGSNADGTPTSDGNRVYVAWATETEARLAAFSLDGNKAWDVSLGPCGSNWGFCSSPATAEGLVFVLLDNARHGSLVAVESSTGRVYWRRSRPPGNGSDGSYSSPVVFKSGEQTLVAMAGMGKVQAYHPITGQRLWQLSGLGEESVASPCLSEGYLVACSGYPERKLLAASLAQIDPNSAGAKDLEGSELSTAWEKDRSSEVPFCPTLVIQGGKVFVLHDTGLAYCWDLDSGKKVWKKRVVGDCWASPVYLGGKLLITSQAGEYVWLNAETGEELARNQLDADCFATPVPSGDQLYLRTGTALYCVGATTAAAL